MEPRPLRRPPPPLARDNQETVALGAKQDRLKDTALADRIREFVQRRFVELDPRLIGIGANPCNVDLPDASAFRAGIIVKA